MKLCGFSWSRCEAPLVRTAVNQCNLSGVPLSWAQCWSLTVVQCVCPEHTPGATLTPPVSPLPPLAGRNGASAAALVTHSSLPLKASLGSDKEPLTLIGWLGRRCAAFLQPSQTHCQMLPVAAQQGWWEV